MAAPPAAAERWTQQDLSGLREKYKELLLLLANHPRWLCHDSSGRYLGYVSEFVPSTEVDSFSTCLVHILSNLDKDRVLPAIKTLVEQDFQLNLHQPQTIMRGNCAASKVQTIYCKKEGKDYLQFVLGDFIRTIIVETQAGLDFTIDPQYSSLFTSKKVNAAAVRTNLQAIHHYTRVLLDRLLDVDVREQMPRNISNIRAIAAITSDLCRAYYPDGLSVLVGGFINLRFFSPAICVPWSYGLISLMPSDKARKNLVMLGKVLQSISNGFVNTKKEPFLMQIEDLVRAYVPRMIDYLASLAFDPGNGDTQSRDSRRRPNVAARSSADDPLAQTPLNHSPLRPKLMKQFTGGSSGTSNSPDSWSDLFNTGPVNTAELDLFAFDLDELWTLHRIVHQIKRKLLTKLSQETLANSSGATLTQSSSAVPIRGSGYHQGNTGTALSSSVQPRAGAALRIAMPQQSSSYDPHTNQSHPISPHRGPSSPQLSVGPYAGLTPQMPLSPTVTHHSLHPSGHTSLTISASPVSSASPSPRGSAVKSSQVPVNTAMHKQFTVMLTSLGPPPPAVQKVAKAGEGLNDESDYLNSAGGLNDVEGVTATQAAHYAALNFFYPGKPNKKNQPTFYLIAARITEAILDAELRPVISFVSSEIKRVIGDKSMSPYAIVIDTSWSHFGSKFLTAILSKFREIVEMLCIRYSLRKRLAFVYIVHPTPLIASMFPLFKNIFPAWQKVIICYQYNSLEDHIAPGHLMLPVESQGFITKAFFVTKVNAKGKHQLRLIVSDNILNLPRCRKSRSLQNEKLLSDIEHITLPSTEKILITFSESSAAKSSKKKLFGPNSGEARERLYICKSRAERDQIMEEIFRICFYNDTIKWPLEYQVIKIEGGIKANLNLGQTIRTYKVTLDSLIILDNNSIKKELPLMGLKSIALGLVNEQPLALRLEFHEGLGHRGRTKVIVCRSSELARALKQLLEHQAKIAHLNLSS